VLLFRDRELCLRLSLFLNIFRMNFFLLDNDPTYKIYLSTIMTELSLLSIFIPPQRYISLFLGVLKLVL